MSSLSRCAKTVVPELSRRAKLKIENCFRICFSSETSLRKDVLTTLQDQYQVASKMARATLSG
jgi:hypothetical protein